MAHPNKIDATRTKSSKFHAMTRDYGMAGKDYMTTPGERLKDETKDQPENSVGFGAESSAASSRRGDKPARRAVAANPVASYKRGGKAKIGKPEKVGHSGDELALNVQSKMSGPVLPHKTTPKTGAEREDKSGYTNEDKIAKARARGGRLHGKGKGTHVNVIVAPQGGSGSPPAGAGAPPPQLAALMAGARPPAAGGPPMGPPPGGPPMPPPGGPPMGMPPGAPPMRAKGGKVSRMGGHPNSGQDKDLIKKTLNEEGLMKRAKGGGISMHAGAATGAGRLQKIGEKIPAHRDGMRPQDV